MKTQLRLFVYPAVQYTTLVVVEHQEGLLAPSNLPTIAAASGLGSDVAALVAGEGVQGVATAVAGVKGVGQVWNSSW